MSNAEIIFNQLENEGFSRIQKMIDEQQEENLFLDFKLKTDATSSNLSKDDKKNFAKALSGFSNTSGGIIIWGVDCRKNEEGVDGASGMVPIVQPKIFLANLSSLISDALTPINSGIRNVLITIPNDHDKGFIATYVPESSLPPHRAMLSVNQYYTRSGESFMRMEHVHLEDMFGRRQKPVLDIYYEIRKGMIAGGIPGQREYYFSVLFGFNNTGKYVARFPAIRVKPQGLLIKTGDRFSMKQLIQSDQDRNVNGWMFTGGADDIIHPETYYSVGSMETRVSIKEVFFLKPDLEPKPNYSFEYTIYAEGCIPVRGVVNIPFDDVKSVIYP